MARYFFDVTDSGKVSIDKEGVEFGSLDEARREALQTLGEIAKDELPDGDHRQFSIDIRQADGAPILSASLSLQVKRNS
jgi:hypothetical protein